MNVFEFLCLDKDHRPSNKVVQLVKNLEEVPESKIAFPLYGQVKKDGVYCMLVSKDGAIAAFGRTGKMLSSCGELTGDYLHLPDGVYIGELCLPGYSLEVLSGIVNPNRTNELDLALDMYWRENQEVHFHDYLSLSEFIGGHSTQSYLDRFSVLTDNNLPTLLPHCLYSLGDCEDFASKCIEAGEEGAVFKADVDWLAGHKGWRSMKRVRRISYDLLCIGAEEGTGKYAGKVANLIFRWKDGKTLKAMLGKGYTHEDAERMWRNYHDTPEGLIYRVYGLQDSSKGKIRLPKVGEHRHDKEVPDF